MMMQLFENDGCHRKFFVEHEIYGKQLILPSYFIKYRKKWFALSSEGYLLPTESVPTKELHRVNSKTKFYEAIWKKLMVIDLDRLTQYQSNELADRIRNRRRGYSWKYC